FRARRVPSRAPPDPPPSCRNCLGSAGKYIQHEQVRRADFRSAQCRPTEDLVHPRLVGVTRVALARVESLLPRAVVEPAEQALKSSDTVIGLVRKVQRVNSSLFRG